MKVIFRVGVALGTISALLAGEKSEFYVLAGQSNMMGTGVLAQAPKQYQKPVKGIFMWSEKQKKFVPYIPTKKFGPELSFAVDMKSANRNKEVYFIKLGLSGQPLHNGIHANKWLGDSFAPGRKNFYPGKDGKDAKIGLHYKRLQSSLWAAQKALADANKDTELDGFVWMQGEADAKFAVPGDSYGKSLAHLKKRVEQDSKTSSVPVAAGAILPRDTYPKHYIKRKEVRKAIFDLDKDSGRSSSISNFVAVEAPKDQMKRDNVHYTSAGYITLGQDFAKAIRSLSKK